jgi:hypothetical protein
VSLDIGKQSSEAQLEELAEGRLDIGLLRLPVLRQREGIAWNFSPNACCGGTE